MTDRKQEEALRAELQAAAGKVKPGSGRRGTPRRMDQVISVRLDPHLLAELRVIADETGDTLSDLLREGAQLVIQRGSRGPHATIKLFGGATWSASPVLSWERVGTDLVGRGEVAAG